MKKIKGLLLFGILTLLGIGSSFSQFIDLRDNSGSQLLIPDLKYIGTNPRYSFNFHLGNSLYLTGRITPNVKFVDIVACYDSNRNIKGFRGGVWNSFSFGDTGDCQYSDNYSIISSNTGTSGLNILNYLYIRNDVPISPYSEKSLGSIDRYLYFDFYKYYTYTGSFSDVPAGYIRDKVFLSRAGNYGIVNRNLENGSYLFTSLFDDSFFIGNEFVNVGFLLLHLGGYDTEYYNGGGTLLLALGDDTGTNSGVNSIIFNFYTGFYIDYSEIKNVSPSLKGYITSGGSVSDGFNKFMSLLTGQNYTFVLTEGNISNNYLEFISYPYEIKTSYQGTGIYNSTSTYLFDFTIYDQVPDFIDVSQGGGNQSTGSEPIFDYNVAAIDYLITCYITSGDVCVFPSFNREDFESTFSVGGSVWNGYSGYLLGDNAYLFLKEYCINSDIINYPFCSQLDLYSGAIIIINYENGSITYDIFSDSFMVSIGDSGSGQIGNVSCLGGGCSSINSGNPEYIHNFNSSSEFSYYSGEFLDSGYYDNFFNLNLTGYFLKCPWSYSSNRKVFGKKLLDNLGGYDILLPLNCFIAAYNHGKSFNFLDRLDLGEPIMGPATTKNHNLLYGFFDLIMSFGLLLFLRVVFKLFK